MSQPKLPPQPIVSHDLQLVGETNGRTRSNTSPNHYWLTVECPSVCGKEGSLHDGLSLVVLSYCCLFISFSAALIAIPKSLYF